MKPQSNGLIELVEERSNDKGFFCMDLVSHIMDDPQFDGSWEYWHKRFFQAAMKQCAYADVCARHASTIAKHGRLPIQLTLELGV